MKLCNVDCDANDAKEIKIIYIIGHHSTQLTNESRILRKKVNEKPSHVNWMSGGKNEIFYQNM